jgi:hypothetical protein
VVARHRDEQAGAAVEVVVDELARDAAGRRDVLATARAMGDRVALVDGPSGATVTGVSPVGTERELAGRVAGLIFCVGGPGAMPGPRAAVAFRP